MLRDNNIPRTLEAAQTGNARLQTLWDASSAQSAEAHVDCCTDLHTHAQAHSQLNVTNGAELQLAMIDSSDWVATANCLLP